MTNGQDNSAARPVLVVGPAWVGDMVMAQSLFISLRQRHPSPEIDVIAPAWSLPLLERMPEVRRAIPLPVAHGELALGKRWRLGRSLRHEGYQQAIVLPRSAKAALPVLAAGIPRRTGYKGEHRYGLLNDIRPLDRQKLYRTVDRFVALGQEADAPLPPPVPEPHLEISATGRAAAREALGLAGDDAPALALCPGAEYGPAKRWPAAYFAEVARDRLAAGWQVWLFGSDKDRPITGEIADAAPGCTDLAGHTTLAQAIDLLASADVVVSNDSGLMHVAAATGRPVVALYGSSDPGYTPPLSSRARILYLGLECSPCFQRECPLGHLNCLRQMHPDRVLEAITTLHREAA
ncbi:lipopolysaccharide heptosyltransferase II [Alkalispirillum mobile]|uniref:lipopolysaccharide heptosyltransferase II n=1 Tax=Alkalispirillum mobile TaxID=85925 RepID=UPI001FED0194|nr:lipopolysaccharide heptosyltransferase II [Alkalispirillum mobile]